MKDRKLDELLKALPRAKADDGFTDRVMRRVAEIDAPRRRSRLPWPQVAIAASLLAAALLVVGLWQNPKDSVSAEDQALLEELRAEYASLGDQIESLRTDASRSPVVYLGGDESVSFVVDLRELARHSERPEAAPAKDGGQALIQ